MADQDDENVERLAIKASATLDQLKSNKMRNNIFTHTLPLTR